MRSRSSFCPRAPPVHRRAGAPAKIPSASTSTRSRRRHQEQQVDVDFYIWFRWEGADLKPPTRSSCERPDHVEDGSRSTPQRPQEHAARVLATITKFWT
jgi:hypothetical protein